MKFRIGIALFFVALCMHAANMANETLGPLWWCVAVVAWSLSLVAGMFFGLHGNDVRRKRNSGGE